MTFSKEDKSAWDNSEIIQEFEKIALETDVLNGPPIEAYQPIDMEEDEVWEEESDEDKLLSAIEELGISEENSEEELENIYTAGLLNGLQKIAYQSNSMKAAYRIERTIIKIKNVCGGK